MVLYAVPTLPPGNGDVVVMESAALTVILKLAVAVPLALSVTFTVNEDVPDALGVPVIAPVLAFKPKLAGSVPEMTLHV